LAAAHRHLENADKTNRKTADKHDLLTLIRAMPEAIRSSLALNSQQDSFERCRNVFTNSRYPYESSSWKFSDPVLMGCCGGRWPTWLAITGSKVLRIRSSWITSLRCRHKLSDRGLGLA
jgi:hypothetical protein